MEVVPKSVNWLLPEETSPCDVFLHFRGQYAKAIPAGQVISFKLLEKLSKAQCSRVYIRREDEPTWQAWTDQRNPITKIPASSSEKSDEDQKQLYGNKRAELLSYVQKSINRKNLEDPILEQAFQKSLKIMQNVVKLPTLDWYFQKFHEPPDLLRHCGRVAFGMVLFLTFRKLAKDSEIETACFSALIHELEGSPVENLKTVVSQQTLAYLEKNGHPAPKEVIQLIELQDELCSGKGFPNNKKSAELPLAVRTFTLFNHFDSFRLRNTGTRRIRFDRTKEQMEANKGDYDPNLWPLFWDMWENQMEAMT